MKYLILAAMLLTTAHAETFYIEAPWGCGKILVVEADDVMDAIGSSGITVWSQREWSSSEYLSNLPDSIFVRRAARSQSERLSVPTGGIK